MALNFPASPSNGDTFAVGGITYTYNSTKEIWVVNDTRASATVFVGNAAPSPAVEGDMYWDEEIGKLLVYYTDGDSSQWVEASSTGSVTTPGVDFSSVNQNIIPSVTETYSLGSTDYKWKDLYLSGNTLVLGSIALKDSNGTFTTATVESNGYIVPSVTEVGAGGGASRSTAFTMSVLFGG